MQSYVILTLLSTYIGVIQRKALHSGLANNGRRWDQNGICTRSTCVHEIYMHEIYMHEIYM